MAKLGAVLVLDNAGGDLKPRNAAMKAILDGAELLGESRFGTQYFKTNSGRLIKRSSGRPRFTHVLPDWVKAKVAQS